MNGAGKTTTIRILTGLVQATSGTASIFGMDTKTNRKAVVRLIGHLPQSPTFSNDMAGFKGMTWTGKLFKLDPHLVQQRNESLHKALQIWNDRKRPIGG